MLSRKLGPNIGSDPFPVIVLEVERNAKDAADDRVQAKQLRS